MSSFRIKIISSSNPSIEPKQEESISRYYSPSIFGKESVCGYNILILDLQAVKSYEDIKQLNKEEIDEFFSKPSVLVCLSDKEVSCEGPFFIDGTIITVPTAKNYDWIPELKGVAIASKAGKGLEPTGDAGRFSNLFNTYEWEWRCSFGKLPKKYIPIARNISKQSVALRADIGEGRVFIIPSPDISIYDYNKYPAFLRQLIDVCEEEVEELGRPERKEPDWVQQHVDPLESKFLQDWTPFYEHYTTLRGARKLFYETGSELTRIAHFVVSRIGFKAEIKEEEGIQDIEIREDDFDSVIEVTSSKEHWIDISKTRQLSDWCRKFEQKQNKKPKGMLIANPYCDLPPKERDEPFTPKALEQGVAEGFCLMTTVQLYNMFCKFLKGEMNKNNIKKLFLETKGLLKLEG